MKILICNTYFYPALGGIENFLLNLGRTYVKDRHHVTVLTYAFKKDIPEEEIYDGINIIRFSSVNKKKMIIFFEPYLIMKSFNKASEKLLSVNKFDVYISRDIFSLWSLYKIAPINKIIYIQATAYPLYLLHFNRNKGESLVRRFYWNLYKISWFIFFGITERYVLKRITNKIVLSKSKLQEITLFYRIHSKEYHVINPGIDSHRFRPCINEKEKTDLRKKLNLPQRKFIFLYVGRFDKEKNPEGIIESIKMLDISDMHFVFVGDFTPNIIQKSRENHLEASLIFTGPISEPAEYFRSADVLLLPSLTEGFGHVIIEAMASGLPVIAFKNPPGGSLLSTDEIIKDGKTGILVEYKNYSKYGKAIGYCMANPDEVKIMGMDAYNEVKGKYTWEKTASQILEVL